MKKRMKIFMFLFISLLVTGCAASKSNENSSYKEKNQEYKTDTTASSSSYDDSVGYTYGATSEEALLDETGGEAAQYSSQNNTTKNSTIQNNNVNRTSKKLIVTVDLNIETLEFDSLIRLLESRTLSLGGYIETSGIESNSYRYERLKYANYTIRIPSENLNNFVEMIGENANILSESSNTKDATLAYYDTESRKKALEIQQERLMSLLEKTDNVADMIQLEARLSEVTYELESQSSVLRNYDNLVEYSTIHLSVSEVERETKVQPRTWSQEMKNGLSDTFFEIKEGFKSFAVYVVVNFPYLLFWGVILFILVKTIIRKLSPKVIKKTLVNQSQEVLKEDEKKD